MFTIIIPIYNTETYLRKCFDSILKQTYDDFEVILIDDGSTDKSSEIIDEYIKKDARFKKIVQKNSGISIARNNGIKLAKNPYIIFIDSDDSINEELLMQVSKCITRTNSSIIRYGVDVIGETDARRFRFNIPPTENISGKKAIRDWSISETTYALPWVYAIKKDIYINNNLYYTKDRIHEDYLLLPFLIANSENISVIDYVGYNYFLRKGSISLDESKKLRNLLHFILCYKDIVNNVSKMHLDEETQKIFLLDQYRRLLKEMIKTNYDIRLEALKTSSDFFTIEDRKKIKDKEFTKKDLKNY